MQHGPFEPSYLLRGQVALPGGEAGERYLHVERGTITSVTAERPEVPEGTLEVHTREGDWIFPGLLDLHTHSDYNVLPIWDSAIGPFDNRFGWRGDPVYRRQVSETKYRLVDADERNQLILEVFAELQAIAGGTTVLQESYALDRNLGSDDSLLLVRDTADPSDLGLPEGGEIRSVVDFFRPDKETGEPSPVFDDKRQMTRLAAYAEDRDAGRLLAVLPHLAEGRSGFGRALGKDPYSRAEFEAFMSDPALADAGAVAAVPLAIIHGSGIDPYDAAHLRFLRERQISVIWSPVSNLLLYGDTLDVEAYLDAGINLALGSDWSPSGSKHVWDEAKFARFYLDALGAQVSDAQIFQMVTENAARCLGSDRFGRIAAGGPADFFVVRSPMPSKSGMEVFLATTDHHVHAVGIGGRPVYGDRALLESFGVATQPLPRVEGTAAANKAVHLPPELDVDLENDLQRVEDWLKLHAVLRSNTLASSDVPYQRRRVELKAATVKFGWSAQRWLHERWKQQQRGQTG